MSGWFNLLRNNYSVTAAHQLPEMDTVGHDETLVTISVTNVTGAPSAATLTARFEMLNPTTSGAITQGPYGGVWAAVDATLHPNLLPDGDWPTTIATETTRSQSLTTVATTSGATTISIGSGGAVTAPFVVGQRIAGTALTAGYANEIVAVGSAGSAGTSGSSGTLRFPAIGSDSAGNATLLTNPVTVVRRIHRLPYWRVVLLPTFTGGSAPAFVVSISTLTDMRR